MSSSSFTSHFIRQKVSSDDFMTYGRFRNCLSSQNVVEKMRVEHVLSGHTGCVNSVLFSECADYIYTGSDDTHVKVYKTEGGGLCDTITTIHTNNIFYARDLPHSGRSLIITCAADGRVALTNMISRGTRQLYRHRGRAHRIALIPETVNQFYSCGEDGVCCLFDIRDGGHSIFESGDTSPQESGTIPVDKTAFYGNRGTRSSIYTVGVNPSRPWEIALAGEDCHVALFDNRMFSKACGYLCPPSQAVTSAHITGLRYSDSGEMLIASYSAGGIYSFDLNAHTLLERRPMVGRSDSRPKDEYATKTTASDESSSSSSASAPSEKGFALSFSGHRNRNTVKQVSYLGNRSEWVLSGSDCGHIFVWSASTAEVIAVLKGDSRGAVNCFATHPNVPYFCSSGLDNEAKLWTPTGERVSLSEDATAFEAAQVIIRRNMDGSGEEDEDDDLFSPAALRRLLLMLLREETVAAASNTTISTRSRRMLLMLSDLMPSVVDAFRTRIAAGGGGVDNVSLEFVDVNDDDDDDEEEEEEGEDEESTGDDDNEDGNGYGYSEEMSDSDSDEDSVYSSTRDTSEGGGYDSDFASTSSSTVNEGNVSDDDVSDDDADMIMGVVHSTAEDMVDEEIELLVKCDDEKS